MKNLMKFQFSMPIAVFLFIYTFLLHVVLFSLITQPNLAHQLAVKLNLKPRNEFVINYVASLNTMHARVDENTPKNAVIFIGDSLIQGLSSTSISSSAVNFGIGHDTIDGVTKRSLKYKSLQSASSILISVGVNDLRYKSVEKVIADYKIMLQNLSKIPHLFIHEILPIDSKKLGRELQNKIILFNDSLFTLTQEFDNITYLKSPPKLTDLNDDLKPSLHLGDGLHLNKDGYDIWIQQLRSQLDAK